MYALMLSTAADVQTIDEEKKKYFKIGATHQVPEDAKYSKSSIQQDKRESKKRKLEDRRRKHVSKQTVGRPKVFLDPLTAGIGLHREHGTRETARSLVDRDAALITRLTPCRRSVRVEGSSHWSLEIAKMEQCSQSNEIILGLRSLSSRQSGSTYTLHSVHSQRFDGEDDSLPITLSTEDLGGPYAAFGHAVTSISTAKVGEDILLFAAAQGLASPGNVFSTRIMPSLPYSQGGRQHHHHTQMLTSNYATLGTTSATSLWQTSIAPTTSLVAVAGTLGVWTLDLECTPRDRLSITRRDYAEPEDDETRAVDWLDAHTVAAGSEWVYLWDQRSGGASQRFRGKGRVTGIFNPERGIARPDEGRIGGQELLISTNRMTSLFDVRYVSKSRPLLSWRNEHEGPQIQLACDGEGLFAAGDRDGYVHVYSTRTGGEVARLGRDGDGKGAVGDLRWVEDREGRKGLRALQRGNVIEWKWGAPAEEG